MVASLDDGKKSEMEVSVDWYIVRIAESGLSFFSFLLLFSIFFSIYFLFVPFLA